MKRAHTTFTFRGATEDIERIDAIKTRHGFKTRAKFLMHAGLCFEQRQDVDDVMAMFSRAVYSLRQLERGSGNLPFLLKENDVTHIRRDIRRTMARVLDGYT